jgi:hypothetical protein
MVEAPFSYVRALTGDLAARRRLKVRSRGTPLCTAAQIFYQCRWVDAGTTCARTGTGRPIFRPARLAPFDQSDHNSVCDSYRSVISMFVDSLKSEVKIYALDSIPKSLTVVKNV